MQSGLLTKAIGPDAITTVCPDEARAILQLGSGAVMNVGQMSGTLAAGNDPRFLSSGRVVSGMIGDGAIVSGSKIGRAHV